LRFWAKQGNIGHFFTTIAIGRTDRKEVLFAGKWLCIGEDSLPSFCVQLIIGTSI